MIGPCQEKTRFSRRALRRSAQIQPSLQEFSARELCLSAVVPTFRRTRHPFVVSGHLRGLHRRLSLCSLPVSKQSGGSLGSFWLRRPVGHVQDLAGCVL